MINGLVFTFGVVALFATANALRPPSPPTSRFPPLWLPAMVTSELATFWLVVRIGVAIAAFLLGAWDNAVGRTGLLLILASVILLTPILRDRAILAKRLPVPWAERGAARMLGRHQIPPEISLITELPYSPSHSLDLYTPGHSEGPTPLLLYVHGGGWTGGDPHKQARTLFHLLALKGWHVATIRYPLSPGATFPEHLIAVKRAISWAKSDPRFDPKAIVIGGGSAGGHLAALAALTASDPQFQPGFEEADTSVAGCVPMYGIYDFFNRNQTRWDWPVIPRHVMKTTPEADPDLYRLASPLDQVHSAAPPFLVIHGAKDSLVPPPEAHQFVAALEKAGVPVRYLEIKGGQHAFDALDSPRSRYVASEIAIFLGETVTSST